MEEVVENKLEELLKSHPNFWEVCRLLGWGRIEIMVKDGKPVMISVRKDIKLD